MFGVQAVPTVIALAGGQPLSEASRGTSRPSSCGRWIDSLARCDGARSKGRAEDAEEGGSRTRRRRVNHLDGGDFDAALAAYPGILDAKPNHAEAKGAVPPDRFLQRATRSAPRRFGGPPMPHPMNIDASPRRSGLEDLAARTSLAAFERLIAFGEAHRGDEPHGRPEHRLIELFDLFRSPRNPQVIAGRRKPRPTALY